MNIVKKVSNTLKTGLTYTLWLVFVPASLTCICLPLSLLPARIRINRLYHFFASRIGTFIVKASFVKIKIHGLENMPRYPQQPAIIIANHSSALDIPLIEMLVGSYPHIWMSKISYGKIPVFGTLLKRMHVMVDRTGRDARMALLNMYKMLKDAPRHALVFPEGTRYADGKVHEFYPGFAILAQKLKRPIIPVVISGLHSAFPKKSLLIDSSVQQVTIHIGQPIHCPDTMKADEFVGLVSQYFEKQLQ
jgi:1-acyl-sn-glycerol-3-phosphate acyltransferase